MLIDAGTQIDAGCTPDGACWPAFVTARPCIVRFYDDLPDRRGNDLKGLALSTEKSCVLMITKNPQAGEGWTNKQSRWHVDKIIAHELGHDNCVTRHKDGQLHCWKEGQQNE